MKAIWLLPLLFGCVNNEQTVLTESKGTVLAAPLQATTDTVLYNGESAPFSSWAAWDSNRSSLVQSSKAPYSKPYHLRATLVNKNWWAGVAYAFKKDWSAVDLSKATTISFYAKAATNVEVDVNLFDTDNKSGKIVTLSLTSAYKKFNLVLSNLSGVSLQKVSSIVFSTNEGKTITYVVDVDNIVVTSDVTPAPTPPVPTPPVPVPVPTPVPSSGVRSQAVKIVKDISGGSSLLFGTGGIDAKSLGLRSSIYYRYLCCGYGDAGWRGWNTPSGQYANVILDSAKAINAVPMFTYYQLAYEFEVKNYGILTSSNLHQYLLDIRLLYTKIAGFGGAAIVQFEPDFFGYLQQYSLSIGKKPSEIPAKIRYSDLPECQLLPETVKGLLDCMVLMGRSIAPKTKIGFHASSWADWYDSMSATPAVIKAKGVSVGNFLRLVGSDSIDFISVETSDRDAGFWEAQGRKNEYLDITNATRPNYTDHFTWTSSVSQTANKPLLWWQMPFGVPSTTQGGTDGHYRDNRVKYFFSHTVDIVNSGGWGVVFGAGADKQTTPETDGGQFKKALDSYLASPQPL